MVLLLHGKLKNKTKSNKTNNSIIVSSVCGRRHLEGLTHKQEKENTHKGLDKEMFLEKG